MHSSNFYRNYGTSSPYKVPPSKSANSFESSWQNRSRSNLHDTAAYHDETWPLDEVINKIDIKLSDSEDDFGVYGGGNRSGTANTTSTQHYPWRSSSPSFLKSSPNRYKSPDRVYSAFPESSKSWSSSRQLRPTTGGYSSPLAKSSYDTNNNYLSEDSDLDDFENEAPLLRDVAIQCNLKRYSSPLKEAVFEVPITQQFQTSTPLSQKPPIKVIKSSTNGFVSAYSDVPKLNGNTNKSTFHDTSSPYAALDFDTSHDTDYRPTPEPTTDIATEVPLYSQVEKGRRRNNRPPSANSTNNNINIVYKQPLNESMQSNASNASTYRSMVDGKVYDVKTKDYGFSVATNPNAPRFNLSNPMSSALTNSGAYLGPDSSISSSRMGSNVASPRLAAYTSGSYRDLHDIPLTPTPTNVEKEIIEETISISNASTEENSTLVPPYRPTGSGSTLKVQQTHGYGDNLSFTSKTSSNYGRRESPVRPYNGTFTKQPSPYSTLEQQNTLTKSKKPLKKKKVLNKNDENVLLANNSLRLKSSRSEGHRVQPSERLYKSNADLRDQFMRDETRGGLAAAYNRRQATVQPQQQTNRQRALSLNRMNAFHDDEQDGHSYGPYQNGPPPHQLLPTRYHSQTHLNGGGTSSRLSDSSSYHRGHHRNHERDPIVMYIPPTVNHRPGDGPKLTSILRNNSTKSTVPLSGGTLPSSSKKKAAVTKSQSKTNLKEAAAKEKEKEKEKAAAAKKKADLNRRHSMPKDAKLNGASGSWFSKFKLKSNK